jgi:predicted nucleotidyltransferase
MIFTMGGLPDYTLNTLDAIFQKYSGIQEVILYGSRAKGNYRTGSDIDITLKTDDTFTRDDLLHVARDLDDSDMPYFVDVSNYGQLTSESLKVHIDRVGKILYLKKDKSDE